MEALVRLTKQEYGKIYDEVLSRYKIISVIYDEDDCDKDWSTRIRREMKDLDFLRLYCYRGSRRDSGCVVLGLMELTEVESDAVFDLFLTEVDKDERSLVGFSALTTLGYYS